MSIARFIDLYPLLQVDLPKCPTPLILQTLQQTMREFCTDTGIWREDLTAMDIVADQEDYTLASAWTAEIYRVVEVRTDGDEDSDPLDESEYTYDPTTEKLTLVNPPTAALTDGLLVKVVIIPELYCEEVEEAFLNRWGEGIVAGTKAKLMAEKNKVWSSPERVPFFQFEYDKVKAKAKIEITKKYKQREVSVQFRRWA